jgi:Ran GTPase-activating protein (RanGAP) involved in mRNA processing and transport
MYGQLDLQWKPILDSAKTASNLWITQVGMGEKYMKMLTEVLAINKTLDHISFTSIMWDDKSIEVFAGFICSNTTLKTLHISGGLSTKGVIALGEALRKNNSLVELIIGECPIGDEGMKSLAKALLHNTSLYSLRIERNLVDADNGIHCLANAIKMNKSLKRLCFILNNMSDENVKDLSEALKTNNSITELTLCGCKISKQGAHHLSDMLASNNTLRKIFLGGNQFGFEGVDILMSGLRNNKSLHNFDLSDTKANNQIIKLDEDILKEIQQITKRNTDLVTLNNHSSNSQTRLSVINEELISDDKSIVAIMRLLGSTNEEHTFLLIETLKAIIRIELVIDNAKKGYTKILIEEENIDDMSTKQVEGKLPNILRLSEIQKSLPLSEQREKIWRYFAWDITQDQVDNLMNEITKDHNLPPQYSVCGDKSYIQGSIDSQYPHDKQSCFTWARKKLEALNDKDINEKLKVKITDYIAAKPSWYLNNKYLDNITPFWKQPKLITPIIAISVASATIAYQNSCNIV